MTQTAAALRERFQIHGRYYQATLDGRRYELRSHLEIFERSLGWPQAASRPADLVAVMMNPGGSRPLAEPDADGWAPALPDRTQYQLMKLALAAQAAGRPVRHLRVLNLSDLRTPKSAELFATLAQLRDDRHSIFSVSRRAELEAAVDGGTTPVLCAWGMSPALEPLIRQAQKFSGSWKVLGLTDDGVRYRHPLPQRADLQREWLDRMREQIARLPSP